MHLFTGDDTFASYQAAKTLLAKLTQETDAEVLIVDGDEIKDPSELLNYTDSLSLFAQPTVVFLKRPFANNELSKYMSENIDLLLDKDIVVWSDKKSDKRLKLIKTLDKQGKHSGFEIGKLWEVERWFSTELGKSGLSITQQQIAYVMQRLGHDKWLLNSLVEKLILLGSAEGQVSDMDLASLVGAEAQGDIWRFLDSLNLKNKTGVLDELEKLTRFEDSSQYIIAMLTRELGLLAKVIDIQSSGGDFSKLKLHPFVLDKTKQKAGRFTWGKVKKLYQALFRLDLAIKQGRLDPMVGLTMFVLSW